MRGELNKLLNNYFNESPQKHLMLNLEALLNTPPAEISFQQLIRKGSGRFTLLEVRLTTQHLLSIFLLFARTQKWQRGAFK